MFKIFHVFQIWIKPTVKYRNRAVEFSIEVLWRCVSLSRHLSMHASVVHCKGQRYPLFGQVIHGGCNDFTQWQSKYTNSRRYLTFFVLLNSLFRTIICGCGTMIHVHTRSTFDWIFPKLKLFLCVHSYVGRWFDFCSLFSFSEYKMTTRVSSLKTSGLMKKINKLIINTTYIFSKSTTHWCYMYNKVKKVNSLTRICLG